MLEVLDRIQMDQQKRVHNPMTEEDMASELAQKRGEDDGYKDRWCETWSLTDTKTERTDTT